MASCILQIGRQKQKAVACLKLPVDIGRVRPRSETPKAQSALPVLKPAGLAREEVQRL